MSKNISQIVEFEFMAWEFLLAIYESSWDKLIAKENKTFRQSVLSQFNKTSSNNMTSKNLSKGKQANISRILPLISPKPRKNILAKSKFFKKNWILNSASQSSNWLYI